MNDVNSVELSKPTKHLPFSNAICVLRCMATVVMGEGNGGGSAMA